MYNVNIIIGHLNNQESIQFTTMICKKKQIQTRKIQTNPLETIYKNPPLTFKRHIKHCQQQKSYEIVPWHVRSHSKIISTMINKLQPNITQKHQSNQKEMESLKQKQKKKQPHPKHQPHHNPFHQNHLLPMPSPLSQVHEPSSPTRQNMLECSFRLEQYEQQKAIQIKNAFMNDILANNGKKTIDNKSVNNRKDNRKNFVERNIQNAFELDRFSQQRFSNNAKKTMKTIQQQAKQQLLLDNQKLKQQSKDLNNNFVSMKNEKFSNNHTSQLIKHYYHKLPMQTVWNMTYVQKQNNPESTSKKDRRERLLRGKRGKSQRSEKRSNSILSMDQKSNYAIQNQLNKNTKTRERLLSRKLQRMWKTTQKSRMECDDQGVSVRDRNDRTFHRIHSLTPTKRHKQQSLNQLVIVQSSLKTLTKAATLTFSKFIEQKPKQRSCSALVVRRQTNVLTQQFFVRKVKPQQTQKLYTPKNFLLSGNQCLLAQLFID